MPSKTFTFLSRLCGGEEDNTQVNFYYMFLSRLCGGEYDLAASVYAMPFSKPPVWR